MAGVERFLGMKTESHLRLRPGLRLIQDGATAKIAKVITAQIYIHQFSSDGAQSSKGNLQMTDLDLLRGKDCEKMSRSIQLEQFLGLSVSGLFTQRVRQTQAGEVFRPITLLFSCVPVKRFRRIQLQLRSSPTLGKART